MSSAPSSTLRSARFASTGAVDEASLHSKLSQTDTAKEKTGHFSNPHLSSLQTPSRQSHLSDNQEAKTSRPASPSSSINQMFPSASTSASSSADIPSYQPKSHSHQEQKPSSLPTSQPTPLFVRTPPVPSVSNVPMEVPQTQQQRASIPLPSSSLPISININTTSACHPPQCSCDSQHFHCEKEKEKILIILREEQKEKLVVLSKVGRVADENGILYEKEDKGASNEKDAEDTKDKQCGTNSFDTSTHSLSLSLSNDREMDDDALASCQKGTNTLTNKADSDASSNPEEFEPDFLNCSPQTVSYPSQAMFPQQPSVSLPLDSFNSVHSVFTRPSFNTRPQSLQTVLSSGTPYRRYSSSKHVSLQTTNQTPKQVKTKKGVAFTVSFRNGKPHTTSARTEPLSAKWDKHLMNESKRLSPMYLNAWR
eukprot:MONOS_3436.1-p1 / transcript=MONOS_3436.1 / gene=MONOS_3436 / organism=Monocercomonoides_exilis_PA203 / gene_product=unspecified product / transcript_product=unspecified product / location=Mono_scaffold00081:43681-44952(+) / protein_length=424 / sequence_SO=supercontig / SO=protein_coding / is_pseudo=false